MPQGTLKINTDNLLPIIKQWLYSDKDIFIRELISNACDAIRKLQILRDQHIVEFSDESLRIDLIIDKSSKTLQFVDTGIGMTADEIEKYIAQIAFSGAEEFILHYQNGKGKKDEIIGHFGLGFYSAYMVAENVIIDTLSHQPEAAPALWSCKGDPEYVLETGSRTSRGTTITLSISPENEEFLEEARIRQVLLKYCRFLPYPIFLNAVQINDKQPLWIQSPSECTPQDYIDFYRVLYPTEPDPLFWVHINLDAPIHLKGILYFPKINRGFDWTKSHLQLFSNRVFVSDNCKDLIPDFLSCLRGAIDSPDIPVNVSRSVLQMDTKLRSITSHIAKKVADKLALLHRNEKESFLKIWPEMETIVKLGILQDEKFYTRSKEFLLWKTVTPSVGWITAEEYQSTHSKKVLYTNHQEDPLLSLHKGSTIIYSCSPIDQHLFSFLEQKLGVEFQRTDANLESSGIDPLREKTLLDLNGQTEGSKLCSFFKSALPHDEHLTIEAKSLSCDLLPACIVTSEATRRLQDMMLFASSGMPPSTPQLTKRTLVLNTNSRLMNAVYQLRDSNPELAKDIANYIYDLSSLSQKTSSHITAIPNSFINQSIRIMEKLISSR